MIGVIITVSWVEEFCSSTFLLYFSPSLMLCSYEALEALIGEESVGSNSFEIKTAKFDFNYVL